MARSSHHGCGQSCGVCKPHKKWKTNSTGNLKPSVRRKITDLRDHADEIDLRHFDAELEKLVPCAKCSELAEWSYMPSDGFYCGDCVPRGCSCNILDDGTEELDVDGRQLPCCEWEWIGGD